MPLTVLATRVQIEVHRGTPPGFAWIAALVAGWGVGAGCGVRGGPGEDQDLDDGPRSGCQRACAVAEECLGGTATACQKECEEVVSGWGRMGEEGAVLCAECLEAHECIDLAEGACEGWCAADGSGGFVDLDLERDDGPGCRAEWQMEDHEWTVTCEPFDGALDCGCWQDGLIDRWLTSLDFCDLGDLEQLDRANRGCGWSLGLMPSCSPSFVTTAGDWASVVCQGTALGWDCECQGATDDAFFSTEFCELDFHSQAELANVQCRLDIDPQAACSTTYSPDVTYLTVQCEDGQCRCIDDGRETGSFDSDYCMRTSDERRDIAADNCGWDL